MSDIKKKGLVLASTAALLFASGFIVTNTAASETTVRCMGGNACKGQSDCRTPGHNACPGSNCRSVNTCKGQGWKKMSPSACEKAGGVVE